jgi:hypothetical protein
MLCNLQSQMINTSNIWNKANGDIYIVCIARKPNLGTNYKTIQIKLFSRSDKGSYYSDLCNTFTRFSKYSDQLYS